MNIFKKLGWDKDMEGQIRHAARTTRDNMKHLVLGKRVRSSIFEDLETYHIFVFDRTGLTTTKVAESGPLEKDELDDAYKTLLYELDLPFCCEKHRQEYEDKFEDSLFGEDEDPDDDFDLFGEKDDEEFNLFGNDEDEFQFDFS